MKPFFSILILFFQLCCLKGQQFQRPNIEFGGIKIDWQYTVEDTSEVQESNNLPFLRSETGISWNSPVEFDGKIIYNIDNHNPYSFGNIISCYDLKSGEQKWIRYINPVNEDGYCYNFYHSMLKSEKNELILTGARSLIKSTLTRSQANYGGRYIRKKVNLDNGNDIETYLNDRILTYKIADVNPDLTGEKELYYNLGVGAPNAGYSERYYPYTIDIENDTAININGLDTIGQLTFNTVSDGGIPNSIRIDGPFTDKENEYTYMVQYERNRIAYQLLWIIDKSAKILFKKDISDLLRGPDKREHYVQVEQKDNKIYLTMKKNDNSPQGHRGYAVLDMKGNLLRKNTAITIEGKKVGHIVTTPIKKTTDLMNIIRFQNSNDLFFYKETTDKTQMKLGLLENKNSSAYAYIPQYAFQTTDDGMIVSGSFLLDTITQNFGTCRFDCGGWPVIMKLSSATLGLTTSTQDGSYADALFTISPNPSTDRVTITIKEIHQAHSIYITDQTGRRVLQNRVSGIINELDISALQAGMYFVSLTDDAGRSVGRVEKLVKM